MNTRTSSNAAEAAAESASQAARVLQQRGQDVKAETLHLPRKDKPAAVVEPAAPEVRVADEPRKDVVGANEFIKDAHRGNKFRDAVVDEIRAKRGEPKGDEPAAEPEAKPADPKPTVAPQQEADVSHETTPASEKSVETVKTVRAKVDGEEFDVPEAEVNEAGGLKAFQIQRAVDNRLKKANEALASVRATQDQSVRTHAQIAEWIKNQKPQEPVVTDEQFIQSKVDEIRFGTPEESAKALQAVLTRNQQPKTDQGQLVQQAIANINRNAALVQFRKDFQDVATNEIIKPSFEALERAALSPYMTQAGVNWNGLSELDFSGIYNKIGHQVRSVMGPRPSQPLPDAAGAGKEVAAIGGSTSQLSEKEARKSSIVEPPKAAAARAALPTDDSKPETREEQLKRIKRSRGLPVD